MGFEISAGITPFGKTSGATPHRETFSSLISAAKSGDLTAAKTAFNAFASNRKPPAGSPLAVLGAAIESGDAKTINEAAQALQKARKGPKRPDAAPSISTAQPGVAPDRASAVKTASKTGAPPVISTVQPVETVDDVPLINVAQRRDTPPLISTAQDSGPHAGGYSVDMLV
jgi:hypothetical protein